MGVGSLKKGAASVPPAATSPEADAFINGAKVDGKNGAVATNGAAPARKKKWKQVTFSLTDEMDQEVERLSRLPTEIRNSRSAVVRAALLFLASQGDAKVATILSKYEKPS